MKKNTAIRKKIITATGTILASGCLAVFFWKLITPADFTTASLWLLGWGLFSLCAYIIMSVFVIFPDIIRAIKEEREPLIPDDFLKEIQVH
jgi:hypothetical protein